MSDHLADDQLLDVLEGREVSSAHDAAACALCAQRLAEASAGLGLARAATAPELSAFEAAAMRRRIAASIGAVERRRSALRWLPALAAAAALVALVPRIGFEATSVPQPQPEPRLPAWSALPADADDIGLEVLAGVADLTATLECSGLECLTWLSEEEVQLLSESMPEDLARRDL